MNKLEVGQEVTLKIMTITPLKAKVIEVGNTYAVLKHPGGRIERVALRDAHRRIEGFNLYEDMEVTDASDAQH